jgi:pyruvate-ferredoxin/flavodoxin oxidoreductase
MRLALDAHAGHAVGMLHGLAGVIGDNLVKEIVEADQSSETGLAAQRARVVALRARLQELPGAEAARLHQLADYLVRKNVWIVGGDGWAYDIGFGGLDHVLSLQRNINILILDTEVYSNTGGQQSKATPLGASAKFASAGKETAKKDLGMMAMSYGHVYVARVAFGAKDTQTVKAFQEAESWHGPSLIIAYSHCIAHGYDMAYGAEQQKLAVDSGVWPLYRYDPRRVLAGHPPLVLDSAPPKISPRAYMRNEARFQMVEKQDPQRFKRLLAAAEKAASQRFAVYQQLAGLTIPNPAAAEPEAEAVPPAPARS